MSGEPVARRYEFGSREDRSLLLGLRAGQLGLAALTVVVVGVVLRGWPSGAGLAAAAGLGVVGAAVAFVPVGGAGLDQWAPLLARFGWTRVTGRRRWLAPVPLGGLAVAEERLAPPPLAGVRLLAVELDGGTVGVAWHRTRGVFTAVLRVRGGAFGLVDAVEQERRLEAWGRILAGLARAGSPVHRVQWLQRSLPEETAATVAWLHAHADAGAHPDARASYERLLAAAARTAATRQECLLAVSVSAARGRRAIRQAGGGQAGGVAVLLREARALAERLEDIELTVDGLLSERLLAGALRSCFEPTAASSLTRLAAVTGAEAGTDVAHAWPLATETSWDSYRIADSHHATFLVSDWPRSPVPADWLAPLLLSDGVLRTVSVAMDPLAASHASRQAEGELLRHHADDELRARGGWRVTARRERDRVAAERREQELADGHRDYRLAGLVVVSATGPAELEAACSQLEQAASQAHLELRRLWGRQDHAFAAALPLGVGLD